MNLTWHIVKKDLRALRLPLGLWLLTIVAKLAIGVVLLTSDTTAGSEWFLRMDASAKILAGLECVSFVLVAAIIQEDMLVGTTAFWKTRPISGARLLCAKLAGIALVFLVAPIMVTLPWWLGCHYGMHEIAWAAQETLVVHAIFVLLGLLWSGVTDGFARFLAWTLVTLFAIPTMTMTLMYYATGRGHHGGPSSDVMISRIAIAIAVGVVAIGVVVVHQFLTRRTARSIGIIGGFVGLIVVICAFLPVAWHLEQRFYNRLASEGEGGWPASAEPAGLKFTLAPAAKLVGPVPSSRQIRRLLHVNYRVDGLPANQMLSQAFSAHQWRWPDGTSETGHSAGFSDVYDATSDYVMGFVRKTHDDRYHAAALEARMTVSQDTAEKLLATTPAYTLDARLYLAQIDSIVSIPKQGGPRHSSGVTTERVADVQKDGEALLVTLVRSAPTLWIDYGKWNDSPQPAFGQYLLVNAARDFVDRGWQRSNMSTQIGSVGIEWKTLAYRAVKKEPGKRPSLEAMTALDDAELVKVSYREVARFTHVFTTDAFVTESAP